MQHYRKMAVHRYVKIEKNKHRQYHITEFNELVQLLYPYRQSINKYKSIIDKKTQFNTAQKQLILQTAQSLTIVNELYRDQDKIGRFYVTREDVFNAIFMLQNELSLSKVEYLLSPVLRWYYRQIYYYYNYHPFTAKQLGNRMEKAKTTVHKHLSELVDRNLIAITGQQGHAYVYQLIDKHK